VVSHDQIKHFYVKCEKIPLTIATLIKLKTIRKDAIYDIAKISYYILSYLIYVKKISQNIESKLSNFELILIFDRTTKEFE
jgi:hypothetical protein